MPTSRSSSPAARRYVVDCVEVRRLTAEERALYPPPSPFDDLVEILGEWQEKGEKLYFARRLDNEVHKVSGCSRHMLAVPNVCSSILHREWHYADLTWWPSTVRMLAEGQDAL
jgi:hypothetical protein